MTKLSKEVKNSDNAYIKRNGLIVIHYGRVTIVGKVSGEKRGHFSVAICGKDEPKFRKSIGVNIALYRWAVGERVPFEFDDSSVGRLCYIASTLQSNT